MKHTNHIDDIQRIPKTNAIQKKVVKRKWAKNRNLYFKQRTSVVYQPRTKFFQVRLLKTEN